MEKPKLLQKKLAKKNESFIGKLIESINLFPETKIRFTSSFDAGHAMFRFSILNLASTGPPKSASANLFKTKILLQVIVLIHSNQSAFSGKLIAVQPFDSSFIQETHQKLSNNETQPVLFVKKSFSISFSLYQSLINGDSVRVYSR